MTLWELRPGSVGIIQGIPESLEARFQDRLVELGFGAGQQVECLRKTAFGGPGVYRVGDSIFSLGSDVALAVRIEDPA